MEKHTELLIDRLEVAYRNRFDSEAALIFLNDAYQEYMFLREKDSISEDEEVFFHQFMDIRDLFICLLVDRYPSNYAEVDQKIKELKGICDQPEEQRHSSAIHLHPSFSFSHR